MSPAEIQETLDSFNEVVRNGTTPPDWNIIVDACKVYRDRLTVIALSSTKPTVKYSASFVGMLSALAVVPIDMNREAFERNSGKLWDLFKTVWDFFYEESSRVPMGPMRTDIEPEANFILSVAQDLKFTGSTDYLADSVPYLTAAISLLRVSVVGGSQEYKDKMDQCITQLAKSSSADSEEYVRKFAELLEAIVAMVRYEVEMTTPATAEMSRAYH